MTAELQDQGMGAAAANATAEAIHVPAPGGLEIVGGNREVEQRLAHGAQVRQIRINRELGIFCPRQVRDAAARAINGLGCGRWPG
ncbi:MAG: hypothetical protein ACK53L_23895, partial [Pirellulaceae bacterium]